jgi:hypothetical protein
MVNGSMPVMAPSRRKRCLIILALVVVAALSATWLRRPKVDPRIIGEWIQNVHESFSFRADGYGELDTHRGSIPFRWSVENDVLDLQLGEMPGVDGLKNAILRVFQRVWGEDDGALRPHLRWKIVEIKADTFTLEDSEGQSKEMHRLSP